MHTKRSLHAVGELRFELSYRGLFDPGHSSTFPCDPQGCVALNRLSDRAHVNYQLARTKVGFDLAAPVVLAVR